MNFRNIAFAYDLTSLESGEKYEHVVKQKPLSAREAFLSDGMPLRKIWPDSPEIQLGVEEAMSYLCILSLPPENAPKHIDRLFKKDAKAALARRLLSYKNVTTPAIKSYLDKSFTVLSRDIQEAYRKQHLHVEIIHETPSYWPLQYKKLFRGRLSEQSKKAPY